MNQLEYYQNNKDDFLVKKHKKKDLYLIKHKRPDIDWSQPYALESRGIVLDGDSNVVSRPYNKFFSHKELLNNDKLPREIRLLSKWDDDEYTVTEKIDGRLCVVSQYEGELLYTSLDNFQGTYPHKFKSWFDKNLSPLQKKELNNIAVNYTLLFEYTSPDDRIVIDYNKEDMILHGIINTEAGGEIFNDIVFNTIAESIGVSTANRFGIDYKTVMNVKQQDFKEDLFEGFVVRFDSGKRLVVKTDDYLKLHSELKI